MCGAPTSALRFSVLSPTDYPELGVPEPCLGVASLSSIGSLRAFRSGTWLPEPY